MTIKYTYTDDIHLEIMESYKQDDAAFCKSTSTPFPQRRHLREEVDLLKQLLFPECWNADVLLEDEKKVQERVRELGTMYFSGVTAYSKEEPSKIVDHALEMLPEIRHLLKKDVEAAYKGDPAANSYIEIIRSYPGLLASMMQRTAHTLYNAGAPEYARELTEYAKTETGIDIHPGAEIGEHFFIDHGTGVVIGETTTIGNWVRIYQDVTLGALHFEEKENDEHELKKGYKRHPDIGDCVVIGAGSKVLGPITIGDHVSIGANSWVTSDIADNMQVFITDHPNHTKKQK